MAKYKLQNIVCILGLAVGILSFTVCLYFTRFVFSTDSCFEYKERITVLSLKDSKGYLMGGGIPATVAEELRQMGIPQMESITCIPFDRELPYNVHLSEDKILPYKFVTLEIDSAFNSVFGIDILAGSWESAVMQQNSIIISRSTAERIFGNAFDALGKTMMLSRKLYGNGGSVYNIAAVMEDIPLNSSLSFMQHIDLLRLNDSEGMLNYINRKENAGTDIYVLLGKDAFAKGFSDFLNGMGYVVKMYDEDWNVASYNLKVDNDYIIAAGITLAIGVMILVMALLNFFNFLVSFFYTRIAEYSVRKVFGSTCKQLFLQLYAHVALMLVLSALLMFSLIEIFGDGIRISLPILEMELDFGRPQLMEHSLQYIVLLFAASAVICWFIVRRLYRISVFGGFSSKPSGGNVVGRNIMLWWQLFITWIFLGFIFAMTLQSNLSTSNLFPSLSIEEKQEILSVPMKWFFMNDSKKEVLVEKFKGHSGVIDVMVTDIPLMDGYSGFTGRMYLEDDENKTEFGAGIFSVPDNYFSFMNMPLLHGRMPAGEREIVVDEKFAELRSQDVLDKTLLFFNSDGYYTVCGIADLHNFDLYHKDRGFLYIPNLVKKIRHCYIKCYPGQVRQVREWVNDILSKELPPNVGVEIGTFLDDVHAVQVIEFVLRKMFIFFAVVCVILTLLGVYAGISFDTLRRQKEVALRKINGAGKFRIAFIFIRLYAILLTTSAAVAFPILYYTFGYWKLAYKNFFDYGFIFWTFLFVIFSLLVYVTIVFKIIKIADLNPATVIKQG
ncbi:MAG: ABC transporter permease [Bacteroidales bacterium]|nr:ABC transporter permease [Bacteroidales bacterium]